MDERVSIMSENIVGDIAKQMAALPIVESKEPKAPKEPKGNPLLKVLGSPQFVAGDGKKYPRTTGFGSSRKPHPDGGTNETLAYIIFKPFESNDVTMEGRIYAERYVENGKRITSYSITLPMLKVERRDAKGKMQVDGLKSTLRKLFMDSDLMKAIKA